MEGRTRRTALLLGSVGVAALVALLLSLSFVLSAGHTRVAGAGQAPATGGPGPAPGGGPPVAVATGSTPVASPGGSPPTADPRGTGPAPQPAPGAPKGTPGAPKGTGGTPTSPPAPAPPKTSPPNIAAQVSGSSVTITWGSVGGATGYELELAEPGGSVWKDSCVSALVAKYSPVPATGTWDFKIRAYDGTTTASCQQVRSAGPWSAVKMFTVTT